MVFSTRNEASEIGIDLGHVATLVCDTTGVSIEALRGRSRSTRVAEARKALAIIAVDHFSHSVTDVTQLLQKHPGSVSRWLEAPPGTENHPQSVSKILDRLTELNLVSKTM
jgi:hypothetical protein